MSIAHSSDTHLLRQLLGKLGYSRSMVANNRNYFYLIKQKRNLLEGHWITCKIEEKASWRNSLRQRTGAKGGKVLETQPRSCHKRVCMSQQLLLQISSIEQLLILRVLPEQLHPTPQASQPVCWERHYQTCFCFEMRHKPCLWRLLGEGKIVRYLQQGFL